MKSSALERLDQPAFRAPAARTAVAGGPVPTKVAPERSDVHLVRDCIQGNDDAWAALLEKYNRLIYSIPVKYGFSADEASDIFQEVCVELLSELPRLREPQALPKWLMQVTAHKCSRLKKRDGTSRRATESDGTAADIEWVADSRSLSDEMLLELEREQALRDAVSALSPRCRQLVEMLFFETPPRPYRQIAEHLELACGSIGFIRGRCLDRLRVQLQKHGFR